MNENSQYPIDTHGIKNKENITYLDNNTKTNIKIYPNKVILIRDNTEINHAMTYDLTKMTKSEYYLKEYNTSLYFNIRTTSLDIKENYLKISYQIEENNETNEYIYLLEMSDEK